MDSRFPTFVKNYDLIIKNFKHHKRYLADKRLTQTEKKILQAHCDIRNNENRKAIEQLSQITENNEYLRGVIALLTGVAQNNLSFFHQSIDKFKEAKEIFKKYESKYLFRSLINLYICNLNLFKLDEMKIAYNEMSELKLNKSDELIFKRIEFNFYVHSEDYEVAYSLLDHLFECFDDFKSSIKPAFLIDVFNLGIKSDNIQLAYKALDQIKTIKKFHLTENYKFMKALLDYIDSDQMIYITPSQLKKVPLLQNQLMCIKYLAAGDRSSALDHWKELQKSTPETYLDNFELLMPKSLFSIALAKANAKRSKWTFEIHNRMSKVQKLDTIFHHLEDPIKKADLYRLIYEEEARDKEDLLKLSKLISKYRKKSPLEIKTQMDSYAVDKRGNLKKPA